jgi:cobalt-zinc-cadmium efflux system outer membrane protein
MSISVPIGNRKRAEPGIAGAQARSASLQARSEQRERELGAELFTHYQAQAAARDAFLKLRDEILPAAERATALYQSGFELGSYSLIELTQAQNQLQELRRKALDAAGQFHREGIEIDYLLGTTTTGPSR